MKVVLRKGTRGWLWVWESMIESGIFSPMYLCLPKYRKAIYINGHNNLHQILNLPYYTEIGTQTLLSFPFDNQVRVFNSLRPLFLVYRP